MSYNIIWNNNNVIINFIEKPSVKQVMRINEKIIGDPRFDSMEYQLWDFRYTKEIKRVEEIEEDQIKIIATLDMSSMYWNRNIKIALVSKNPYIKKMIIQYSNFMAETSWQCKLFEDMKDALKWCKSK